MEHTLKTYALSMGIIAPDEGEATVGATLKKDGQPVEVPIVVIVLDTTPVVAAANLKTPQQVVDLGRIFSALTAEYFNLLRPAFAQTPPEEQKPKELLKE